MWSFKFCLVAEKMKQNVVRLWLGNELSFSFLISQIFQENKDDTGFGKVTAYGEPVLIM